MDDKKFEVVIIGSGPAGLTAAIYTSRANLKTLVLAGDKWGGQLMLTSEVENFPGFENGIMGPELMNNIKLQAVRFGTEIVMQRASKIMRSERDFVIEDVEGRKYESRAVILAMGADTKWLDVPGESKYIGRGVSSCAPCDAAFFRNKKVYVVGGGDSAMEEALVLTKFAREVVIIHRRGEFRASKIMVDRVMNNPKISVLWDSEIVEVKGQAVLSSVVIKSAVGRVNDEVLVKYEGSLVDKNNEFVIWESKTDGVFVAIGHTPNSSLVKDLVDMDDKGYIANQSEKGGVEYRMMTSIEGIFVAGDVHDHIYKQAVTAAASGCAAALECEKWLENRQ